MARISPREWHEASLFEVAQRDAPIGYGIVQTGPYVTDGVPVLASVFHEGVALRVRAV